MKTKIKKLLLSLFAFTALTITACGGSNDSSGTPSGSSGSQVNPDDPGDDPDPEDYDEDIDPTEVDAAVVVGDIAYELERATPDPYYDGPATDKWVANLGEVGAGDPVKIYILGEEVTQHIGLDSDDTANLTANNANVITEGVFEIHNYAAEATIYLKYYGNEPAPAYSFWISGGDNNLHPSENPGVPSNVVWSNHNGQWGKLGDIVNGSVTVTLAQNDQLAFHLTGDDWRKFSSLSGTLAGNFHKLGGTDEDSKDNIVCDVADTYTFAISATPGLGSVVVGNPLPTKTFTFTANSVPHTELGQEVYILGNYNGWVKNEAYKLDYVSEGVWSKELTLLEGNLEYKLAICGATGDPGWESNVTYNRTLAITNTTTDQVVTYGTIPEPVVSAYVGTTPLEAKTSKTNPSNVAEYSFTPTANGALTFKLGDNQLDISYVNGVETTTPATKASLNVVTTLSYNVYVAANYEVHVYDSSYVDPATITNFKLVGSFNSVNKWAWADGITLVNDDDNINPTDKETAHQWKQQASYLELKDGDMFKFCDNSDPIIWKGYYNGFDTNYIAGFAKEDNPTSDNIEVLEDLKVNVYLKLSKSDTYSIYVYVYPSEITAKLGSASATLVNVDPLTDPTANIKEFTYTATADGNLTFYRDGNALGISGYNYDNTPRAELAVVSGKTYNIFVTLAYKVYIVRSDYNGPDTDYRIVGIGNNWNYGAGVHFEPDDGNKGDLKHQWVARNVVLSGTDQFKLFDNENWISGTNLEHNPYFTVTNDGYKNIVAVAGTYDIYLKQGTDDGYGIYIDPVFTYKVGSGADAYMRKGDDGDDGAVAQYVPIVDTGVTFAENDTLSFKRHGTDLSVTLQGDTNYFSQSGNTIKCNVNGTYDIYLKVNYTTQAVTLWIGAHPAA